MKRHAAALAAAATGILAAHVWLAGGALAGPSTGMPIAPVRRAADVAAPEPAVTSIAAGGQDPNVWTEPAGSFSFWNGENWKEIEAASPPGAPVLEIVGGDKKSECWFERIVREKTARLSPSALIAERAKPLEEGVWSRLGAEQQLLQGQADVLESRVERRGIWPVQTARLRGRQGEVVAALHARPGMDLWVFCASKDSKDRSDMLRQIALSVTTPKDVIWERQFQFEVQSQTSFTAVP